MSFSIFFIVIHAFKRYLRENEKAVDIAIPVG